MEQASSKQVWKIAYAIQENSNQYPELRTALIGDKQFMDTYTVVSVIASRLKNIDSFTAHALIEDFINHEYSHALQILTSLPGIPKAQ